MTKLLDWIARRLALWITASALLTIGSMWAISALYRAPAGEEQPKVTDWMQAWGSVFGVVAGLAAAGAAALLLLHERQRAAEAERQLADERAEIALNVPRAVVVTPATFGGYGPDGNQHINQVLLAVNNYGGNPIRNVAVIVALADDRPQIVLRRIPVIGPGDELPIDESLSTDVRVPGAWTIRDVPTTVTVCFIDHTNQAWQVSDGEISRTTAPYPAVEKTLSSPGSPTPS